MTSFSKILCVVDPTQKPQPGLIRATWLARRSGAALVLLICCYDEYLSGDLYLDSKTLEQARSRMLIAFKGTLEELAGPIRDEGITVATDAVWDHPLFEGIVRKSIDHKVDVVFKDTHHHSALSRILFTNTDWNLIRTCPVPLWLVSPKDIWNEPQVIASIDPLNEHDKPAALDDQILAISNSLAVDLGGAVHAFHAYDSRVAVSTATANVYIPVSLPIDEIDEQVRQQHSKRFAEIVEFHGIPEDRAHLISGLTHEELPKLAGELEAAVVVMGAVSRNKLKRLFIGATAERTLPHLPCDLLIVKPNPFTTPVESNASNSRKDVQCA
ncbi:MAG: universal stress protein [Woeseia sp.]|jgi:universal stress protein E|nr:universal stress protein [Woeseia sp.]MBT6209673.1 universal stress protein [Woeseia sp.]